MVRRSLFLLFPLLLPAQPAPDAPAVPEWNQPVAPFKIAANLFYVGASNVSAFLLASPHGHILIDTGFRETETQIEANLRTLGFKLEDVKIILASHAHYDHAGAVASLKARTRARFLANPAESAAFARGGRDDFAFANKVPFPPVSPDGPLADLQPVRLGPLAVTPLFTPGHTRGCTSYLIHLTDNGKPLSALIACSMSAPGYQLANNPKYPEIALDFESSFKKLRALNPDIFLSAHAWDFPLHGPFPNPQSLNSFLDKAESAFRRQLAAPPPQP